MRFPRLYPIIDKATLAVHGIRVSCFAGELARAGVGIVQYRDKVGAPQGILRAAGEVAAAFAGVDCRLVMNDRADLAVLAGWGAVHVGQGDMPVEDARKVLGPSGTKRERGGRGGFAVGAMGFVGVSTHTEDQVVAADTSGADYIAVGPVFVTSTKADAEPAVGLEGVRRARALTSKPLVAIGGITLENARSALEAGADSVAVIGGLFVAGRRPGLVVRDFLDCLR